MVDGEVEELRNALTATEDYLPGAVCGPAAGRGLHLGAFRPARQPTTRRKPLAGRLQLQLQSKKGRLPAPLSIKRLF